MPQVGSANQIYNNNNKIIIITCTYKLITTKQLIHSLAKLRSNTSHGRVFHKDSVDKERVSMRIDRRQRGCAQVQDVLKLQ